MNDAAVIVAWTNAATTITTNTCTAVIRLITGEWSLDEIFIKTDMASVDHLVHSIISRQRRPTTLSGPSNPPIHSNWLSNGARTRTTRLFHKISHQLLR